MPVLYPTTRLAPHCIDMSGQRYGMLSVISLAGKDAKGKLFWNCICDCQNSYIGRGSHLRAGHVRSCGCQEGKPIHGLSHTRGYHSWHCMHQRCYDPKHRQFKNYGARGITICYRWHDVANFIADLGQPPTGLTIERINNNLGYWCGHCDECKSKNQPVNCRWDTMENQNRNHRSNHYLTVGKKTATLVEWVLETGIAKSTILNRLRRGWSEEAALTTTVVARHRRKSPGVH